MRVFHYESHIKKVRKGPVAFRHTKGHQTFQNDKTAVRVRPKSFVHPDYISTGFTYSIFMNTWLNMHHIFLYRAAANIMPTFKEINND